MNGSGVIKVENTHPTKYEKVKVWTALSTWYPDPVSANIRNLKIGSGPQVSINLDNALLYSGGQTISIPQTFMGAVHVEGNLVLEDGVSLAKGALKLNKADVPYDNATVTQKVSFAKVSVDDPGIFAPNFSDLPPALVDNIDHVAPKAALKAHIKGKLKIVPDEADVKTFAATGDRIGLVNDKVNGYDISDLYDNAAWLSAPGSLPDITSSSVISFDAKFNADQLQTAKMPPNNLAISLPTASNLNPTPLSNFVRKAEPGGVYNIGGDKTFVNITETGKIVAQTFNGKTLDQFVNKKDAQVISKHAKFNAGIKATDVVGYNGNPLVDKKNLTEYFNDNVAVLLAMEKNKHFNTITIGSGATLKIDNMINSYNLKERTDKIVRADNEQAEISGNKIVQKAASLGLVKVDQINAAFDGTAYAKSYEVKDFVNIKNAQSIPAGKTFSGEKKEYTKVFSHDTSGRYFSTKEQVLKSNPDNSDAGLFSILYRLEEFRNGDGKFQFKLCYPEIQGIGGKRCNEWIQSSNPTTDSTITGFQPISLAFVKNGVNSDWEGLGINQGPRNQGPTLIDDAPSHYNYYSGIGAFSQWVSSPGGPTFPGPRIEPHEIKSPTTKVELFVLSEGGSVTLGDVSFLGSKSDIVTINGILRAPPLTNCFIDINSELDFVKVDRKVSFEAMTTNYLEIAKGTVSLIIGPFLLSSSRLSRYRQAPTHLSSVFRLSQVQC